MKAEAEEVPVVKVGRGVSGHTVTPMTPAAQAARRLAEKRKEEAEVAKAKKTRCCSKCGKPGHRSDGCPLGDIAKVNKVNAAVGKQSSLRAAIDELVKERDDLNRVIELLERRMAK